MTPVQFTINWHIVGWVVLLLMLLFSCAVSLLFIVLYATKGKAGVVSAVQTIEADAEKVVASPAGQAAVADMKALAKEAVSAVLAEVKQAPTPALTNHPFVADAIALAKHAELAQSALALAQAATKEQAAAVAAAAPPAAAK